MILAISVLFGIIVVMLAYFVMTSLSESTKTATDNAIDKANTRLADMFLFLDLDRLVKISLAIIFVVILFLYLITESLILPLLVGFLFAFLPKILISYLKKKRLINISSDLPDFLLNTSSALRAGSGLNQAIELSATEQGGAISQEFGLFLSELRLGIDMGEALENIQRRVNLPEMDMVVAAIKISREVGGNLGDVLHRLSDTLRRKIEMENKIKTLTAQGRMQGIVMVCLPIFIGVVLFFMEATGPYIVELFTKWYGWSTLAFLAAMLSLGYFFIRKIVNIDV